MHYTSITHHQSKLTSHFLRRLCNCIILMSYNTLLVVALLLVSINSASVTFLDKTWHSLPQNITMEHILNLFRHDLAEATSHDIQYSLEYIRSLKDSTHNHIPSHIEVYLADTDGNTHFQAIPITNYVTSKIPSQVWAKLADYTNNASQVGSTPLSVIDAPTLNISELVSSPSQSSRIVIWGSPEEHKVVRSALGQHKRLLQTTNDSSYLIKFFFSIMFLLVSFAVLYAIADMTNQRDSLLYAKFIADVGAR